jgi:hypothetical protein
LLSIPRLDGASKRHFWRGESSCARVDEHRVYVRGARPAAPAVETWQLIEARQPVSRDQPPWMLTQKLRQLEG